MHFFLSIERSHQRLWVPSHVAAHHDAIHAFPTSLKPHTHTHTLAARARARYPSHRLLRTGGTHVPSVTTYSWKDAPVGEARHPEARHPEARRSAGLPGEVPLEDGVG